MHETEDGPVAPPEPTEAQRKAAAKRKEVIDMLNAGAEWLTAIIRLDCGLGNQNEVRRTRENLADLILKESNDHLT